MQGQPVGAPVSTVVPDVPEYTANVGLDYNHDLSGLLSLIAHVDYTYTGQRYDLVAINQGQMWSLPGYGLASLRIGVKSGSDWNVSLFCTNLANPDCNRVITSQRRTIGLDFSFKR